MKALLVGNMEGMKPGEPGHMLQNTSPRGRTTYDIVRNHPGYQTDRSFQGSLSDYLGEFTIKCYAKGYKDGVYVIVNETRASESSVPQPA